ncbi:plasmid recombinant protein (plasmid) [Trichormus variabilis ATCC 29413]|uniref:Plasmid recombinant protein n=1 Tax=Trichormus variabilis (strain ATCC 29413 / PCC 7937) TaxID=240292 RepID=Q3M2N5_TRIV2|nr:MULTISPECIES: DUF3991 domain-containing protein [Nostocaceae]ABA24751.1 plasmid recombinant protein [Trichormus variabilis ATCC 29413]MBC1217865.1 DUF3991 domain-containing protein [Trichormus variabilis ARAD]MBC1270741.1 DUF3991 domain-containing protein [Trichormus variabilis FSR]MBC1329890.1 DUF3991 domain-containing protein [Trichormus variabilis 9RC]MBD2383622.1 DUF3991 domain-containing protein [Trichormus variabilis FACHB-319]
MLHQQGLVYADSKANAVFVMRDQHGTSKGAFLQGTLNDISGYYVGTHRRDSWFYFHLGGKANDENSRAVLCQSPVETISLAMLEYLTKGIPESKTVFIAIDDPKNLPQQRLQNIPHVQVAFNQLTAARAVKAILPQATQIKCEKDWNLQLVNFSRQLQQRQYHGQELEL